VSAELAGAGVDKLDVCVTLRACRVLATSLVSSVNTPGVLLIHNL
jgi:hypothetical protein